MNPNKTYRIVPIGKSSDDTETEVSDAESFESMANKNQTNARSSKSMNDLSMNYDSNEYYSNQKPYHIHRKHESTTNILMLPQQQKQEPYSSTSTYGYAENNWSSRFTSYEGQKDNYRRFSRRHDPEFNMMDQEHKQQKAQEYKQQLEDQIKEKNSSKADKKREQRVDDQMREDKFKEEQDQMREEFNREHSTGTGKAGAGLPINQRYSRRKCRSSSSIHNIIMGWAIQNKDDLDVDNNVDVNKSMFNDCHCERHLNIGTTKMKQVQNNDFVVNRIVESPKSSKSNKIDEKENQDIKKILDVSTQTDLSLLASLFDDLVEQTQRRANSRNRHHHHQQQQQRSTINSALLLAKSAQKKIKNNHYNDNDTKTSSTSTTTVTKTTNSKLNRSQSKSLTHLNKLDQHRSPKLSTSGKSTMVNGVNKSANNSTNPARKPTETIGSNQYTRFRYNHR